MDDHAGLGVKDRENNLSLPVDGVSQTLTESIGDAHGAHGSAEPPLSGLDHENFENMENDEAEGTCELGSNGRMKVMGREIVRKLETDSEIGIVEKVGNFSSGCVKVDYGKDCIESLDGAVALDQDNRDDGGLYLEPTSAQSVRGPRENSMQRTAENENGRESNDEERVVRLYVDLNIEKKSAGANMGGDMTNRIDEEFDQGIGVGMDTGIRTTQIAKSVDVLNSIYYKLEDHSVEFKKPSCQLDSGLPDVGARLTMLNVSSCQKDLPTVKASKTSPLITNRVIQDHISGSGGDESTINLVVDLNPFGDIDLERTPGASSPDFSAGDLVWGKVRSHPWWPGQILEPSAASEIAKKYIKEDPYLIAYFGDQTFAWVSASKMKAFEKHFSQMDGQSDSAEFRHAVDCALDEISRRVEFGLSCLCMPKHVYNRLQTQFIINAGIRDQCCRRDGGDRNLNATSFEPLKLINYLKSAAISPFSVPDKLELVLARAQVLSFHRSKGYIQYPESKMLGSQVDNGVKNPSEQKVFNEMIANEIPTQMVFHKDLENKDQVSSKHKRKCASYDCFQPFKRERRLSDLMCGNQMPCPYNERISEGSTCDELMSLSPVRKRKAVITRYHDELLKDGKSNNLTATSKAPRIIESFRFGDGIQRSTGKMTDLSPSLEFSNGIPQEAQCGNMQTLKSSQHLELLSEPSDYACTEEMLSQLCLAARDPVCPHSFVNDMFIFFSKFSNFSREQKYLSMKKIPTPANPSDDDNVYITTDEVVSATSDVKYLTDSYWTDRLIESIPENKKSLDFLRSTHSPSAWYTERGLPSSEPQLPAVVEDPGLNAQQLNVDGNSASHQRFCPTSLTLKFTNLASIPTEPNLNKIFSRFGPLIESETKILVRSCQARVVFRRRADAETAFSSSGKYSTFGPSLTSYRLKYMAPKLQKSTGRKRGRKPAKCVDDKEMPSSI